MSEQRIDISHLKYQKKFSRSIKKKKKMLKVFRLVTKNMDQNFTDKNTSFLLTAGLSTANQIVNDTLLMTGKLKKYWNHLEEYKFK